MGALSLSLLGFGGDGGVWLGEEDPGSVPSGGEDGEADGAADCLSEQLVLGVLDLGLGVLQVTEGHVHWLREVSGDVMGESWESVNGADQLVDVDVGDVVRLLGGQGPLRLEDCHGERGGVLAGDEEWRAVSSEQWIVCRTSSKKYARSVLDGYIFHEFKCSNFIFISKLTTRENST